MVVIDKRAVFKSKIKNIPHVIVFEMSKFLMLTRSKFIVLLSY